MCRCFEYETKTKKAHDHGDVRHEEDRLEVAVRRAGRSGAKSAPTARDANGHQDLPYGKSPVFSCAPGNRSG